MPTDTTCEHVVTYKQSVTQAVVVSTIYEREFLLKTFSKQKQGVMGQSRCCQKY